MEMFVQRVHAGGPREPDLHVFVTSPFWVAVPAHATLQGTEEPWERVRGFQLNPAKMHLLICSSSGCGGGSFVTHCQG